MTDRASDMALAAADGGAGRAITLALQVAALVAPLVSIYAALFMAPLLVMLSVAIGGGALWQRRRLPLTGRPLIVLLGVLVAWGAVTSLWSPFPTGSIKAALQLLALVACGAVTLGGVVLLDVAEAKRVGRGLATGILAALAIYVVEMALNSPVQALFRENAGSVEQIYSPFNRGLAVLAVLLPACLLFLQRRGHRVSAWALLGAGLAIIFVYFGSSIALAVAAGLLAAGLSALGRRVMTRLIGGAAMFLVLMAPLAVTHLITPDAVDWTERHVDNLSVPHRLAIWRFVSAKVAERPILGYGLDASRNLPGNKDQTTIHTRGCQPPCGVAVQILPLHPHNMALQWWLELGFPGALIGAFVLLLLFIHIARVATDAVTAALLVGQLTVAIGISGLSYGAWQSWWLATLILGLALARTMLVLPPASIGTEG